MAGSLSSGILLQSILLYCIVLPWAVSPPCVLSSQCGINIYTHTLLQDEQEVCSLLWRLTCYRILVFFLWKRTAVVVIQLISLQLTIVRQIAITVFPLCEPISILLPLKLSYLHSFSVLSFVLLCNMEIVPRSLTELMYSLRLWHSKQGTWGQALQKQITHFPREYAKRSKKKLSAISVLFPLVLAHSSTVWTVVEKPSNLRESL